MRDESLILLALEFQIETSREPEAVDPSSAIYSEWERRDGSIESGLRVLRAIFSSVPLTRERCVVEARAKYRRTRLDEGYRWTWAPMRYNQLSGSYGHQAENSAYGFETRLNRSGWSS